nr:MAG TPA: hypothetical protein [Bacteriophage sp.]
MKHYNLTICLLVILLMCVTMCCNRHNPHAQQITTEQVDSVDTIKMTPMESVNMMLDIRKEMIESHHVDSVYMAMPEDIITLIVFDNPDCDVSWVVKHYEENTDYYTDVLKQKQKIEDYKKQQSEPDTLPNKPHPDISVKEL